MIKQSQKCPYLTKPLGVGILATAQKKGLLEDEHKDIAAIDDHLK
jgi:selenophosphate synthase